jgi:Fe-S-cluster containining protein
MIKQFLESEYCLNKCRCCCRFSQLESVWSPCLLDAEIEQLLKHNMPPSVISQNKKIRLEPFPKQGPSEMPAHIGPIYICPFLNIQDSKCAIYAYRPFECQLYPFLINKRSDKVFLSVDLGCPFVKEKLDGAEFKNYALYLLELINQSYLDVIKHNPQIIQAYEEAKDLFELEIY